MRPDLGPPRELIVLAAESPRTRAVTRAASWWDIYMSLTLVAMTFRAPGVTTKQRIVMLAYISAFLVNSRRNAARERGVITRRRPWEWVLLQWMVLVGAVMSYWIMW